MATQFASGVGRAVEFSDLRRRLLYTLGMLVVFRVGAHIPTPGVNIAALHQLFSANNDTFFGLLNLFAGGALAVFAVFAMSVIPYVNASIIMQLLTLVIPQVEEWSKEGQEGQKKINQWTRYGTVALGLVQATALAFFLRDNGVLLTASLWNMGLIVLVLTAGTTFLMWIGEQMTEYGIGNGISLLITVGILSALPTGLRKIASLLAAGSVSWFNAIIYLILTAALLAAIVYFTLAYRRITVQYARRVVGRRVYGGQSSYLPIKVNQAGVIPVIFAVSLLIVPITLVSFFHVGWLSPIANFLNSGRGLSELVYNLVFAALIIAFTFFYTPIIWNPVDVADNIKKAGGFIPGIRPGRPTAEYLSRVLLRVTVLGAIFLAAVAVLPVIFTSASGIGRAGEFGGTALLIVVAVAIDTMQQIEGHLLMRRYQGFLR